MQLTGRSLLTLGSFSASEIRSLIDLAIELKRERPGTVRRFQGMTLAMLFEKRSTRTRCAFETAFGEDGGHPVFLGSQDIHLGVKESIEDTARVLGRMFSAIQFRGFAQETAETLGRYSGVPVYNGLTDRFHPTQCLADLMTMQEAFGSLQGLKLAYVGDARNNVARSLAIGCATLGVTLSLGAPDSLRLDAESVEYCRREAAQTGAQLIEERDPRTAAEGAHAVYTDVWVSMGEESQEAERYALLEPYRVTDELMDATGRRDSIFLHCLPAVKGNEVTEPVFEGPRSRVFDQAENRKHTIKAVMAATLV